MNYYPFHIGDYTSATQHLTLEEDAMYRRLLDLQYTSEKPLPKDERQLFRLTRAATEAHREAVLTVLREFFDETEEGWVSRRAMAEIETMREKQQKQRDKANRRWDKLRAEHGNAPAVPQHQATDAAASNGDANAMPPTPTPTPTPTPKNKDSSAVPADKPRKRKISLPDDFAPNEGGVKAALVAGLDLEREVQSFRDWHLAQGSTMADWQAAWRTWVGKAVQFGRGGKGIRPAQADWAKAAGFSSVYEAENEGCRPHNAHLFRNGKRMEAA